MANEVEVIPITVDYTNRDYYSIREAMIERVKDRLTTPGGEVRWAGTDANDFGIALIEAFSYMGDVMSYYIDRVANEMSLETANQRQSILNISKMFGYTPSGYQSATCTLTLQNTLEQAITLPLGTQFYGTYDSGDSVIAVIFETQEEVTISARVGVTNGTGTVSAAHGENIALRGNEDYGVAGEDVGASNGSASQEFRLSENQVVEESVRVFVLRNTTYEEWTPVSRLIESNPSDTVFSTTIDANNFVSIIFGDGISGKIPPSESPIKVQYVIGGGTAGRVPANIGFTLYAIPGVSNITSIASSLIVANSAAVGGSNPESSSAIRRNAPFALTALNRAVSLSDFANITLSATSVGKAQAFAETFTSVLVYVAPAAEDSAQDPYPLYDPATYVADFDANDVSDSLLALSWETLESAAVAELENKTQIGVTATVLPPTYTPVELTIRYTKVPNHLDADIISTMRSILDTKYGYTSSDFGATIYPEDIETWIRLAPGIKTATVTELYRRGDSPGRRVLVSENGEILRVLSASADIAGATSDAIPSDITLTDLTTTFNPATFTYSPSSTTVASTTVRVTNNTAAFSAIVTYNGVSQEVSTSGLKLVADVTLSALGTQPKPLVVQVIAEDGVTSTTYTYNITKTA
jgi:hypothetical protein